MGLKRQDYNNILSCIVAYNASIKLLDEDVSLAYSMIVYCLESLAQKYDAYEPVWEDYTQDIRVKLEKQFESISEEITHKIKQIHVNDAHLKLSKRFRNFVIQYLDDDFYSYAKERDVIKKDDIEVVLNNAYIMRSGFAHMLKPIMKQLTLTEFSRSNDTFEIQHDTYFTYSGLLRTVRTVITNFISTRQLVTAETYDWTNELPNTFVMEPAPYFWIWKKDGGSGAGALARFEGLLECIFYHRDHVPDMNDVINIYLEHLNEMNEKNRYAAYALCYLYTYSISNIESEIKNHFIELLDQHKNLSVKCCITNIALFSMQLKCPTDIAWPTAESEEVVLSYIKKNHKKTELKLPTNLETYIYVLLANAYSEESAEKRTEWLNRAYYNAVNNDNIQHLIKDALLTGSSIAEEEMLKIIR